jgi:hypothetical protein
MMTLEGHLSSLERDTSHSFSKFSGYGWTNRKVPQDTVWMAHGSMVMMWQMNSADDKILTWHLTWQYGG